MSDTRVAYAPYVIGPTSTLILTPAAAAGYTGPGDIVASALGFWGLRAYSAAFASSLGAVIDIVDGGGGNKATLYVKADGTLNTDNISTGGTLAAWLTANGGTAYIEQLYDQAGTNPFTQSGAVSAKPILNLTAIGGKPVLSFTGNRYMTSTTGPTQAQAFSCSMVAHRTTVAGQSNIFCSNTNNVFYFGGSGLVLMYWGSGTPQANATENAPHGMQFVVNGASSTFYVDNLNTNASGTPGVNGLSGAMGLAADTTGTARLTGYIAECGAWAGDFTASRAALYTDQHNYYAAAF